MATTEGLRRERSGGGPDHLAGSGRGWPLARRLLGPFRRTRGVLLAALALCCSCFVAAAGASTITEFPLPGNSSASSITAGPDGALWISWSTVNPVKCHCPDFFQDCTYILIECRNRNTTHKIGQITTDGAITEFPLPTGSKPDTIIAGPDGALWFTASGNTVGRITTDGAITEFPLPTGSHAHGSITAGPDGALWFTEYAPSKIGRITTDGIITEFPLPSSNNVATDITAGPDGALWFTENLVNDNGFIARSIGRITTAGAVTEFPLTVADGVPSAITAGSDRALWFTLPAANKIGRITTAGAITRFSFPTASGGPTSITAGPDGALWFTEGSKIGRITADGVITEFPLPTGSYAYGGITAGPDGALWFTEGSKIGRITTTIGPTLAAAVLPSIRSVQMGSAATAFATVINLGPGMATDCSVMSAKSLAATFTYQTTDAATNALTGSPNTPVDIPAGRAQSFVVAVTPTSFFDTTDVQLSFDCANTDPAPITAGVNTFLLSASAIPAPDLVALAATPTKDGTLTLDSAAAFSVATVNSGIGEQITVSADTGGASLPVSLALCQTEPGTGACLAPPTPTVTTQIDANATPTFGIFVTGSGHRSIPLDPATNRIFVRLTDSGGVVRGATSVAVQMPIPPDVFLSVGITGVGMVTSRPGGISCGQSCGAGFPRGTTVTVTAQAFLFGQPGGTFVEWGGDCASIGTKDSTSHGTCTLVMTTKKSVSARFLFCPECIFF